MKLIPTWGTAFAEGPRTELRHPELVSLDVPSCWAFAAREGTYLPSQGGDPVLFNNELIRGQQLIHKTPDAALGAINYAFDKLKVAISSAPDWLRNGENDVLSKLSIQRRHSSSWYILPPEPSSEPPTDEYLAALEALITYYGKLLPPKPLRNWAAEDSDPPDTNSGWPMFSSQLSMFMTVLGSLLVKPSDNWPAASAWVEASTNLAQQIGAPGDIFTVAVARRAGPTRKAMPVDFSYWDTSAATKAGVFTRTRLVYMVSRLFNMAISPLSMQVKSARSQMAGFWHTPEKRAQQMKAFAEFEAKGDITYESDFSGYDTSFTPQHRLAIYAAMRRHGFAAPCLDMMEMSETSWQIITPSPEGPKLGHAAMYRGRLGLLSGMKETSNLDSVHAQAIVLKYFIRKKMTTLADIASGKWPLFLNLGDDVLLSLPRSTNVADYEECCAEEGVKAKMFKGNRMLMRHIRGGRDYAVAARVVQQTLANEDSYDHLGHIALALAARLEGLIHPHFSKVVEDILLSTITGDFNIILKKTGLDVNKLISLPEVADFIKTARGKSWLQRELSLDARPTTDSFKEIAARLNISLPNLLTERDQQLTLLFNQSKPVQQFRTILGEKLLYRG
jgi:hypothetical protein